MNPVRQFDTVERRKAWRVPIDLDGEIVANDGGLILICAVPNWSGMGARLDVPISAGVPDRLVVAIRQFGWRVDASVIWRNESSVGVRSVAAKPMGCRQLRSLIGHRDWLLARIAEKPDVTLRALVAELNARSIRTSYGSVWRLLRDEGISFKKKPARLRAGPA